MPNMYTFCEANKICYEFGLSVGKHLKIPVFEDLQYILKDAKLKTFWLEYNALFTPRVDGLIAWRYHDLSIELTYLKGMKSTNLPLSYKDERHCVIYNKEGLLEGVQCISVNNVICVESNIKHVNQLKDTDSSILLKQFTIEQHVESNFVSIDSQSDGCYKLFTKHSTYDCILQ
ncbi:unnamed protein product [Schistosoma margrebowiei]|uniref:Uncharacterized protein n=1 Tax=Schistosoma margrebowiei TaxID=48269 RepID=A0A183MUT3_9TREM|nr:unnamed protein product [Schistosoma margrebowiei]